MYADCRLYRLALWRKTQCRSGTPQTATGAHVLQMHGAVTPDRMTETNGMDENLMRCGLGIPVIGYHQRFLAIL